MAKGKKLDFVNAKIKEENGKLIIIERDEADDSVEVESRNLIEELKKFESVNNLKFTVKEKKPRNMKPRAKMYKYTCECGQEIKSKIEDLEIKCLKCNSNFKKEEE